MDKISCHHYDGSLDHCFRKDGMSCPEMEWNGKQFKCCTQGFKTTPVRSVPIMEKFKQMMEYKDNN